MRHYENDDTKREGDILQFQELKREERRQRELRHEDPVLPPVSYWYQD